MNNHNWRLEYFLVITSKDIKNLNTINQLDLVDVYGMLYQKLMHAYSFQAFTKHSSRRTMKWSEMKSLSHVRLFATLWTVTLLCPWDSPGKSTGVGCHFLLQEIFSTQGSNPGLPHCRQMLYHMSHQGSSGKADYSPPMWVCLIQSTESESEVVSNSLWPHGL